MTSHQINPTAATTADALRSVIAARIVEIRQLIAMGWTLETAIDHVRTTSTLGPASWSEIIKALCR